MAKPAMTIRMPEASALPKRKPGKRVLLQPQFTRLRVMDPPRTYRRKGRDNDRLAD